MWVTDDAYGVSWGIPVDWCSSTTRQIGAALDGTGTCAVRLCGGHCRRRSNVDGRYEYGVALACDTFYVVLASRVSGAADFERDGIFLSHSHSDVVWAERFGTLLKPLVRSKRLRLWVDTNIQIGDQWHHDLFLAIRRSGVALLLVSADFLGSDFIMGQELPALIAQRVRLAPVLVGDCLWQHVPELASVKWLHDPGRDGALNLVTDIGHRDRRLREICDRLIALSSDARRSQSLYYNPPFSPADSKTAYRPTIDSNYVEWASMGAVQLGLLLAQQGITIGAQAAYQRAIDSGDPEWAPLAALLLGVMLTNEGDAAGARAAYQRAIDSGHPEWAFKAAAKLAQLN